VSNFPERRTPYCSNTCNRPFGKSPTYQIAVTEPGPLRETRSPVLADAFLAEAVRSGVLTPPTLSGSGPPPKPPPVARLDDILADLDEIRQDR